MANITGNDFDNFLFGTSQNDQILGQGGNDIISGGDGSDLIDGGLGNDNLSGDGGNDIFTGSSGNDTLNGGDGFDTVDYSQLGQSISLLPTGTVVKGNGFGNDQLIKIEKIIADSSATNNTIDVSTAGVGVSINVNLQARNLIIDGVPGVGTFTVTNFDNVIGTNASDLIAGDQQDNQLFGNGGNDIISGGEGNDLIDGGEGNDNLSGDNGNDILKASSGNDTLNGGDGFDTADYSQLGQSITLLPTGSVIKNNGFGNDQLIKIENIIADNNVTNNTIDVSTAGVGVSINVNLQVRNLIIDGVPGVGTFTVTNFDNIIGTNASDLIAGDQQNNQLFGNSGNDIISGGDGNDVINGGLGNDNLSGGGGSDTFVFKSLLEGTDTITDYNFAQGDIIEISKLGFGASSINDFSYDFSSGQLSFLNTVFAVIGNNASSLSIQLT